MISLKLAQFAIGRFATLFPPPTEAGLDVLADVWIAALGDSNDSDLIDACRGLLSSLKRFPYPADILEAIRARGETPNVVVTGTTRRHEP